MADAANSMAEKSLSVFFTPLPFFLHPYHVLPSSTTSIISLLSFNGPLSVFPAPPCLSFSHLCFCTPLPVYLRPLACFFRPLAVFYDPCLSLLTSFCLPSSTLSLVSLLPLACLLITPSVFLLPLVYSILIAPICLSFFATMSVFFALPCLSVFSTPFCLFFPQPCL